MLQQKWHSRNPSRNWKFARESSKNQQNHRPHPILPNVKGWRRMKLRFVVSALRKLLSRIENYSIFSLEIIDSYSLHPRLIIKWPQNFRLNDLMFRIFRWVYRGWIIPRCIITVVPLLETNIPFLIASSAPFRPGFRQGHTTKGSLSMQRKFHKFLKFLLHLEYSSRFCDSSLNVLIGEFPHEFCF